MQLGRHRNGPWWTTCSFGPFSESWDYANAAYSTEASNVIRWSSEPEWSLVLFLWILRGIAHTFYIPHNKDLRLNLKCLRGGFSLTADIEDDQIYNSVVKYCGFNSPAELNILPRCYLDKSQEFYLRFPSMFVRKCRCNIKEVLYWLTDWFTIENWKGSRKDVEDPLKGYSWDLNNPQVVGVAGLLNWNKGMQEVDGNATQSLC